MTEPLPIDVDVGGWPALGEEQLGTKPKQWLLRPDPRSPTEFDEAWLWKARTFNRDASGRTYPKGDDWAEIVTAEVAERLGLPHAEARPSLGGGDELGVISLEMTGALQTLVHGNELLGEIGITVAATRDRTGYTVHAVNRCLQEVAPPEQHPRLTSAWEWFSGYLLLDTIVGNTDRHHENWGAIEEWPMSARSLAPSFDHASSLGFAITDAERSERLTTADEGRSVHHFAERATTRFEGRPTTGEVLDRALSLTAREAAAEWRDRLLSAADSLPDAVDIVPPDRISGPARGFARELIAINVRRSLSHLSVP